MMKAQYRMVLSAHLCFRSLRNPPLGLLVARVFLLFAVTRSCNESMGDGTVPIYPLYVCSTVDTRRAAVLVER